MNRLKTGCFAVYLEIFGPNAMKKRLPTIFSGNMPGKRRVKSDDVFWLQISLKKIIKMCNGNSKKNVDGAYLLLDSSIWGHFHFVCQKILYMLSIGCPNYSCQFLNISKRSKEVIILWNLVIKRSDITKPSYNKVILLVPAFYISLFFYPDITRNLI